MILFRRSPLVQIETERLILRPPEQDDFIAWRDLRRASIDFLQPWEPSWAHDHLTLRAFTNRVYWSRRAIKQEQAIPVMLFRKADGVLLGGVTLDNIRRGPAQTATTGYWMGAPYARHGYMREALNGIVAYAFNTMDLSRIEAGCLPENTPSRRLLETCGYKYEGVAQSYLQISGRWRNHVLYANLRSDRRGKTDVG
ncbi:ribosomal-protein-alanine N-acetyltransferase [Ketogulonicigenium robustum]|uniref:Ribosomal-protein-alanine N-acetyltransferase n=1 Tax=Ketogulonicigenium robustum TaxID=92947 RepID=A0A1W6NXG8_9RHOB|nr:GNAT family protein [Ketogulonicigenium robustum]ARO13924.1 ribosomal-protein-alanine N-acetyltransferase [Ketogulonicigenium robustum]